MRNRARVEEPGHGEVVDELEQELGLRIAKHLLLNRTLEYYQRKHFHTSIREFAKNRSPLTTLLPLDPLVFEFVSRMTPELSLHFEHYVFVVSYITIRRQNPGHGDDLARIAVTRPTIISREVHKEPMCVRSGGVNQTYVRTECGTRNHRCIVLPALRSTPYLVEAEDGFTIRIPVTPHGLGNAGTPHSIRLP